MTLSRRTLLSAAALAAVGCTRRMGVPVPPPDFDQLPPTYLPALSIAEARSTLRRVRENAPERFKMVHQVSARHGAQQHAMTGYLLGRRDGSFRVSAAAALGPRLFDVSRVEGHWEAKVHLKQLAELDPKHIGRAVARIYFTELPLEDRLVEEGGFIVQRGTLSGDEEVSHLESWHDGRTLATLRKRFTQSGKEVATIDYRELDPTGVARQVRLKDARGFELTLLMTQYVPGFEFPPERLRV